jgi:hypothetical protein
MVYQTDDSISDHIRETRANINYVGGRAEASSSICSASGSSTISSPTPVFAASAALASFLRFDDSLSFSHRSRKRAIVCFCEGSQWQTKVSHTCSQCTCFSFSTRTTRTSSSNSLMRPNSCASRSRPTFNAVTGAGTAGKLMFRALRSTTGCCPDCLVITVEAPIARCA